MSAIKRRKTFLYTVTCLIGISCAIIMGGCQPDEEHLKAEPYQVLESILSTHDITFKETVDVLMEEMHVTEEQVAPYRKKLELATLRAGCCRVAPCR